MPSGPRLTIHSLAEPYLPAPSLSPQAPPAQGLSVHKIEQVLLPRIPVVCPICAQYVALENNLHSFMYLAFLTGSLVRADQR